MFIQYTEQVSVYFNYVNYVNSTQYVKLNG